MSAAMQTEIFGERVLRFTVPAPIVSGNHKTRWVAQKIGQDEEGKDVYSARGHTTKVARDFDERVKSIVLAATVLQGWKMVEWVRMDVVVWNLALDRDNANKPLADALEGLVYPHDSRVLDGFIRKCKDAGAPRVDVVIRPIDPKDYGYA